MKQISLLCWMLIPALSWAQCDKLHRKVNVSTQAVTYQTPSNEPLLATKIFTTDTTLYLHLLAPAVSTADRTKVTIWLDTGEQLIWPDESVTIVADQTRLFPNTPYVARAILTLDEGIISKLRQHRITSYKLSIFSYAVSDSFGEQFHQQFTCLALAPRGQAK